MTIEVLSSTERIVYYYHYVLDKIKQELYLHKNENGLITYNLFLFPSLNDPYKPNPTQEQQIIRNLIKEKIVEEIDERGEFKTGGETLETMKSGGFFYTLKIISPAFDSLYKKYLKKMNGFRVGNVLTLFKNGNVTYISREGEEYTALFNTKTYPYVLLKIMTSEPGHIFSFTELSDINDKAGYQTDFLNDERKVRDAVKEIKKKLKYKGRDLFISKYGFGLDCDVNLR